jgi:hypothetical protein
MITEGVNIWALLVSAVAAFVVSSIYYVIFSKPRARMLGANVKVEMRPSPGKMVAELIRNLVVAFVFAVLIERLTVIDVSQAIGLGVLLWVAFPAVMLSGSVLWDRVPWKLAAIHAGDWLIKLMLFAVILGLWR